MCRDWINVVLIDEFKKQLMYMAKSHLHKQHQMPEVSIVIIIAVKKKAFLNTKRGCM